MMNNNMKWRYEVFEEHCSSEFKEDYIMYGIKVMEDTKIVRAVHFVSGDYEKVKAFTKCLNDGRLDPIHLVDVLQDNMGNMYHTDSLE